MNGLVLAAGGVKGFAHIAVLRLLQEENIDIDIVTGSSAGAIVAALYALYKDWEKVLEEFSAAVDDQLPAMKKYLKKIEGPNIWSIIYRSLISLEEYYPFFRILFGKKRFSDCKIPLGVVVFDTVSLESMLITEGYLVEAVMASSSVPGVFNPVWLGGTQTLDGGVLRPVPVDEARTLGADYVIASNFEKETPKKPQDQMELLLFLDAWKERYIKSKELEKADIVFNHRINYPWYAFEKYREIFEESWFVLCKRRERNEIVFRR
ncbi:MAG: patatin-like phospholipase family protein [Kosmotoga sp.]|uniref:patatin-like phospholipase family protein n=1 Tax=Kosmotoga sp. TaxID=1955248 RepID=UPI001DDA1783|nr:patatin-like phospholipase family protein [Kosmotoga sp.]MBO8167510.1 patatin-like phospholipase family protein [Kosmotoga sp.]